MKQTKLKLSFKARLELFFIKLPMEWRLRTELTKMQKNPGREMEE